MTTSPLPPNQQLAAPGKWPVVGERRPQRVVGPWRVYVTGLVAQPRSWDLDELRSFPVIERTVDVHCVTRWSQPQMRFGGVLLKELLQCCHPLPEARYVSFVARSERNHSTSLPLKEALGLDTLLALTGNGEPLAEVHGGPLRTVVPHRYFYKSLKWLQTIELLAKDRLGFWEREAGYHNQADPWREQRYTASELQRDEVAWRLATGDVSGLDLRSIDAAGRDLRGLLARNATIRDGHLERAKLQRAVFDGANLSNAHLRGADLREASLRGADAEGADFRGADLRGADLTGTSLFGATFVTPGKSTSAVDADGDEDHSPAELSQSTVEQADAAVLDATTKIDQQALSTLAATPVQDVFVRQAFVGDG